MSRKVPRKDTELIAFADAIISGFKTDTNIFKLPPYTYEQLTIMADNLSLTIANVAQNKASYEAAIIARNAELKTFHEAVIESTEYCYRIAKDNKAILAMVGLVPRTEKRPTEPPGQCRELAVVKQEIGRVIFKWKNPAAGGRIKAYLVQRKETEAPPEEWMNLWTATIKEADIKEQPEGKVFDYRVRAINNAGIGTPSNIVTIKF